MEILTKEPYVTERAGHKQVQTDADLFTKYTPKKKTMRGSERRARVH